MAAQQQQPRPAAQPRPGGQQVAQSAPRASMSAHSVPPRVLRVTVPPGVMPGSNPFDTLDRAGRVVKQS